MSSPDFSGIWSAVLIQTFRDLAPYRGAALKGRCDVPYGMVDHEKNRKLAMEWVIDKSQSPRSFIWVCDHLSLDEEVVRVEAFRIYRGSASGYKLFRVDMK